MFRLDRIANTIADNTTDIYDYLIIGAGTSGLQIMEILTKKTKNVLVLEAQSSQGGRIMSESVAELPGALEIDWIRNNLSKFREVFIEKGATWIEERHVVIQKLCKELGLSLREQISEGVTLYLDN